METELKTFHYAFQISRKVVFEVSYYRLGNNKNKYFSTSAAQFNQPKTDFNWCGQAQNDLLKGAMTAMLFYKQFDQYHTEDLTEEQYNSVLAGIEKLKNQYNFIVKDNGNGFSFDALKELSKQPIKK